MTKNREIYQLQCVLPIGGLLVWLEDPPWKCLYEGKFQRDSDERSCASDGRGIDEQHMHSAIQQITIDG